MNDPQSMPTLFYLNFKVKASENKIFKVTIACMKLQKGSLGDIANKPFLFAC